MKINVNNQTGYLVHLDGYVRGVLVGCQQNCIPNIIAIAENKYQGNRMEIVDQHDLHEEVFDWQGFEIRAISAEDGSELKAGESVQVRLEVIGVYTEKQD